MVAQLHWKPPCAFLSQPKIWQRQPQDKTTTSSPNSGVYSHACLFHEQVLNYVPCGLATAFLASKYIGLSCSIPGQKNPCAQLYSLYSTINIINYTIPMIHSNLHKHPKSIVTPAIDGFLRLQELEVAVPGSWIYGGFLKWEYPQSSSILEDVPLYI